MGKTLTSGVVRELREVWLVSVGSCLFPPSLLSFPPSLLLLSFGRLAGSCWLLLVSSFSPLLPSFPPSLLP